MAFGLESEEGHWSGRLRELESQSFRSSWDVDRSTFSPFSIERGRDLQSQLLDAGWNGRDYRKISAGDGNGFDG